MIAFGTRPGDGNLYIATGDGGSGCDPNDNAQNPNSHLGKLLRINVDELPYTIPADNPFLGPDGVADEIWALGLRNPYRFSIDRAVGDIYIGDVGQGRWEEVDYQPGDSTGGQNYGWDIYEGFHCPNPSNCGVKPCGLPVTVLPVLEYENPASGGPCAVTGGYVYRGCRLPDLRGTYFYADFCAAFIRSFVIEAGEVTDSQDRTAQLAPGGGMAIGQITSFGEDAQGEIYITDRAGEVFKIVPTLPSLQVSGGGAQPFAFGPSYWTWENLPLTTMHPITTYRVYRLSGTGSGPFECVFQSSANVWPGGDPEVPPLGEAFTYVVTARNAAGLETSPGAGSDETLRTLSPLPCP
jgi:hypothetical protein